MTNEPHNNLFNFNMSNRFCMLTGEEYINGGIFSNHVGKMEDLSGVHVVHTGVDTIKQRYNGTLKFSFVKDVDMHLSGGFEPIYELGGHKFLLRRGNVNTRYKYQLHARALGVLIHFGDFQLKDEYICEPEKGRVKYEISPNFIYDNGLEAVSNFISHFNQLMMHGFEASGVDVHLCVDIQGWKPDLDIIENMTTFVRKKPAVYYGIDSLEFEYDSSAVSYGQIDTLTWGSASSSQLSIYNKTKESQVKGKSKFWEFVHQNHNVAYDSKQETYRIELRLPSSVVKNIVKKVDGTRLDILDIETLEQHINQLWVYGLSRLFRYDYATSKSKKKTIRPIWQFLLDDVRFNDIYTPCEFKRDYVLVDDSIDKNIMLLMGNLTSSLAKAGYSEEEVVSTIKKMSIYRQILNYAESKKGLSEAAYLDFIIQGFKQKKIKYDQRAMVSDEQFRAYGRFYTPNRAYSDADNEVYRY